MNRELLDNAYKLRTSWYIGEHKPLRLGQVLMNYLKPTETNSEIFYERNANKAFEMFLKTYC